MKTLETVAAIKSSSHLTKLSSMVSVQAHIREMNQKIQIFCEELVLHLSRAFEEAKSVLNKRRSSSGAKETRNPIALRKSAIPSTREHMWHSHSDVHADLLKYKEIMEVFKVDSFSELHCCWYHLLI